jgi:hypothetical protein
MLAYERLVAVKPDESEKDLLNTLRLEYDFARPLQQVLADALVSEGEQPPALICIDGRSWALFDSGRSGTRYVTMYRLTSCAILVLNFWSPRNWEVMSDGNSHGIVNSATSYYQLVTEGWKKRWSAEKWARAQEGLKPISSAPTNNA